jgi:hypothetical protein
MIKTSSLVVVGFIATGAVSCGQDRPLGDASTVSQGTVVFHAVTTNGQTQRFVVQELVDTSGKDYASLCESNVCAGLRRPGSYRYKVQLSINGRVIKGNKSLSSPNEWVTIDLGPSPGTVGEIEGSPVSGHIVGLPASSPPTWIKLQALYSPSSIERAITPGNSFRFESVLPGKWILCLLRGNQVLHLSILDLKEGEVKDLVVDLKTQ